MTAKPTATSKPVVHDQAILTVNWRTLSEDIQYPTVSIDSKLWVPLKLLASNLRTGICYLDDVAIRLAPSSTRQIKVQVNKRAVRMLAIEAQMLPFVLFAARPRLGLSRLMRLRSHAFTLALDELEHAARAINSTATFNQVLTYRLSVERQRVHDRDRQIEKLQQALADARSNPAQLMNDRRNQKLNCRSTDDWRKVAELANTGIAADDIATRCGLNKYTVRQFLTGKYRTAAAIEALGFLKAAPVPAASASVAMSLAARQDRF